MLILLLKSWNLYNSDGMAAYQHVLAVHADLPRRKKRNWADVDPQFAVYYLLLQWLCHVCWPVHGCTVIRSMDIKD
ncbi:hypothetical protein ACET3Z_024956 [Daucus carota]